MNLDELIEQLELLKRDHPEVAQYTVRTNVLDVFMVKVADDGDEPYVELELYRPWALPKPTN
jgi:hypothetical protein